MKLLIGLILREVAGQFVVVPTGKRVQEVSIHCIHLFGRIPLGLHERIEFQKKIL